MRVKALYFLTSCYFLLAAASIVFGFSNFALSNIDPDKVVPSAWDYELPQPIVPKKDFSSSPNFRDEYLSELNARPLFAQTRKPFVQQEQLVVVEPPSPEPMATVPNLEPPKPSEPPATPQVDPVSFRLMGTAKINNELRALISDPEHPEGRWLVLNNDVMGWTITDIDVHDVFLVHEKHNFTLKQYVENNAEPLAPEPQNQ